MASPGKLSTSDIDALNKPGRHADGGGLYLQISEWKAASGAMRTTKSWLFRFMLHGRARSMGLGSVTTFTLRQARVRATRLRQLLADGIDPLELRRRRQHDRAAAS